MFLGPRLLPHKDTGRGMGPGGATGCFSPPPGRAGQPGRTGVSGRGGPCPLWAPAQGVARAVATWGRPPRTLLLQAPGSPPPAVLKPGALHKGPSLSSGKDPPLASARETDWHWQEPGVGRGGWVWPGWPQGPVTSPGGCGALCPWNLEPWGLSGRELSRSRTGVFTELRGPGPCNVSPSWPPGLSGLLLSLWDLGDKWVTDRGALGTAREGNGHLLGGSHSWGPGMSTLRSSLHREGWGQHGHQEGSDRVTLCTEGAEGRGAQRVQCPCGQLSHEGLAGGPGPAPEPGEGTGGWPRPPPQTLAALGSQQPWWALEIPTSWDGAEEGTHDVGSGSHARVLGPCHVCPQLPSLRQRLRPSRLSARV